MARVLSIKLSLLVELPRVVLYFSTLSKVSMSALGTFLYTISDGALQVEE